MAGGTNMRPVIDIGWLGDPNDFGIGMGDEDNILTEDGATFVEDGAPVLINPRGEQPTGNIRLSDNELSALNSGQGDWRGAVVTIRRHNGYGELAANPDDLFGLDVSGTSAA
jgi:hypothetical protein